MCMINTQIDKDFIPCQSFYINSAGLKKIMLFRILLSKMKGTIKQSLITTKNINIKSKKKHNCLTTDSKNDMVTKFSCNI